VSVLLEQTIDDLRAQLAEKDALIAEMRGEVERLKGEIDGTEPLAADPSKWGLKARLEGCIEQRAEFEREVETLKADNAALREALEEADGAALLERLEKAELRARVAETWLSRENWCDKCAFFKLQLSTTNEVYARDCACEVEADLADEMAARKATEARVKELEAKEKFGEVLSQPGGYTDKLREEMGAATRDAALAEAALIAEFDDDLVDEEVVAHGREIAARIRALKRGK
jgi:hypothetical protein